MALSTPARCCALAALLSLPPATLALNAAEDPKDPAPSVTTSAVTVDQVGEIKYRATAGLLPIMDDRLKIKARIFYVAYERLSDAGEPLTPEQRAARPITFAFNGGPGSSSVWLHMGALGPRRVKMGPEGETLPRHDVIPNPHTWLGFTDLVFIDPVSTGYSRPADGEDARQFHGLDEDVRAVAEFIRLYLVRSERWLSPKYLCGESYGTTRAAALAPHLQGTLGIALDGLVLISPVLNFQTLRFDIGNDTPFWLYLPTYTATAWHHRKLKGPLAEDLPAALRASEAFAAGDYLVALAQGDALPAEQRRRIAARLAELTGLSEDFIQRSDLRVPISNFTKELLRDQARTVGRLDSRYTGIDRTDIGATPEFDPSYAAIFGPYTAALNAYVRGELRFQSDLNYEILTGTVNPWNYAPNINRYANVAEGLRSAMSQNRHLRVHSALGYYDLATPYWAMLHTKRHLNLDASLRPNLSESFYRSGHMMYVREEDLAGLQRNVQAFYAAAPTTPASSPARKP
jgi:carboxypeptidase C (cathepsin A)